MTSRFLELKDGIIVEIGGMSDAPEEMHTSMADHVDTTMEVVGSVLSKVLRPLADTFAGLRETVDAPIVAQTAEVEFGVNFSAEGNLFLARSSVATNLKVKVTFSRVDDVPAAEKTTGSRQARKGS